MGGVLPVVADGGIGQVIGEQAVHVGRRPERRLTGVAPIDKDRLAAADQARIGHGQLIHQVVRVLAVVQGLTVPGFARLEQAMGSRSRPR